MLKLLKKFIASIFYNKRQYVCGGEGHIEVVDKMRRVISKLYYNRPTSDMRLNYTYNYQDISSRDDHLREIKEDKEKGGNTIKKIQELLERDLFLPEAEKIFSFSEGYLDNNRKLIDTLSKKKQFEIIKKYYRHHLIQMVALAYEDTSTFKKKF